MKIPDKIFMFGREIKVKYEKQLTERSDAKAESHFRYDEITLQPKTEANGKTQQTINIAFLHEIVHWMTYLLEYEDLNHDEDFIHRMSELLYQVINQIEDKKNE